ncbi:MAG: cell division protein FtsA [Sphingomonadales bacterium]|nr:MAG: cell division protein FtsA [Sphingomonadales bacterium]
MGIDRLRVIRAYVAARRYQARGMTREGLERRQRKLWRDFAPVIARTPALAHLTGKPLEDFPIVRPEEIRRDFARWNTLGLSKLAAEAAAAEAESGGSGEVVAGVSAGFSTGTSDVRGVFLASADERAEYLGQALARLLPWDGVLRRRRIALCLRADSALYRDVGNAGPFAFRFFGLGVPVPELQRELAAFDPHVFVAPSHVLAALARAGERVRSLERVFYGAEPMGALERAWIGTQIVVRPDPIYQATEGFLGAACIHGTLHLNEDTLIIERQPVAGTDRFQPIVTDLRRTTQPMVRVLLDDLLQARDAPCPCGSPLASVEPVEGRVGDLWRWGDVVIAPREVEAAVSGAVGADVDWRVVGGTRQVTVEIDRAMADRAVEAVRALLRERAVDLPVADAALGPMAGFKRRRVTFADA